MALRKLHVSMLLVPLSLSLPHWVGFEAALSVARVRDGLALYASAESDNSVSSFLVLVVLEVKVAPAAPLTGI
jgi:hypothetical protein